MEVKLSRQQRRARARELAKGESVKSQLKDMTKQATATAFDITAQEREEALKTMQSDTIGQMLALIVAYMHVKKRSYRQVAERIYKRIQRVLR